MWLHPGFGLALAALHTVGMMCYPQEMLEQMELELSLERGSVA